MRFKIQTFRSALMLAVALVTANFFSSCSEEEPAPGQETGYITVSLDVFDVQKIGDQSNDGGRVAFAPSLSLSDFGMIIYQRGTSNIVRQYAVGMIPTDSIALMEGAYTAVLDNHQENSFTIGHYSGSLDFDILPGQATFVDVTVTLQEVYFTFTLLENFFVTHHITVEDANGLVLTADAANPYTEIYLPTLSAQQVYRFTVVNNQTNVAIGASNIAADVKGEGYNLKVTQLTGQGVFAVTIEPINVQDEDFILLPTEIVGFTGDFSGANWAATANGSATGWSFSPGGLTFDCPGGGGGFVAQITIPSDGTISFDWGIIIRSAGQYGDRFSYSLNGAVVNLSTYGSASGSVDSLAVSAGDVFAFMPWGTTQSSSYYGSVSNFVFTY